MGVNSSSCKSTYPKRSAASASGLTLNRGSQSYKNKGVYWGKRPLENMPEYNALSHSCLMIDGYIYHVQGEEDEIEIVITSDSNIIATFAWFPFGTDVHRSKDEIGQYAESFNGCIWKPEPEGSREINCHLFAYLLLKFLENPGLLELAVQYVWDPIKEDMRRVKETGMLHLHRLTQIASTHSTSSRFQRN